VLPVRLASGTTDPDLGLEWKTTGALTLARRGRTLRDMRAQVNGTDLFYESLGEGAPLHLLHGGLGLDHTYLLGALASLSRRHQLVLPDLRGNGRSSRKGLDAVTLETWADDVEALRAHLGQGRIVLFGHSFGSFVAQMFALRHPGSLRGLILCSSAPAFDHVAVIDANARARGTPEQVAALSSAIGNPPSSDEEFRRGWKAILPLYFHRWDPALGAAMDERTVYSAAGYVASARCLASFDTRPRLREITAPTLLISGDDDFVTPLEQGLERLAKGIAGAEAAVIEGAGHFPFLERQQATVDAIARWLAGLP
jgi:proline iminopeptidase